jgi:hypothetical protein
MPGKALVPLPARQPAPVQAPPFQQQAKRESEAAYRAIGRWLGRNRHFTVPAAIPVVLWPAGIILHRAHAAVYVTVAGVILAACVGFFAPHKWRGRDGEPRWPEVWYARASAGAAAAWLCAAAWAGTGGLAPPIALAAGTAAWGIPWWRHKRPRGHRGRQRKIARWDAWWQSYCWGWQLGGSRVIAVWETEITARLHIQGVPGRHSPGYVDRITGLIPSALAGIFPPGSVRHFEDSKDGSRFFLEFRRANPLAEPVGYDLALAPRSVSDLAVAGKTETGQWKMAAQLRSRFVIGATGSGKSNDLSVRAANLSGCMDSWQILIDLKGGRSARPLLPAVDYVVITLDEARQVLAMLADEITERSGRMYFGAEQHVPTPEDPAIHLLIDETFKLTSVQRGDAQCARLLMDVASQGRAVAVHADVYTQYGSLESSVREEQTRQNLPQRVLYRVEQPQHGAFAIADYARHDASVLEEPGTFLYKDGAKADTEQIRAPHMPHDLLARIALQNCALKMDRPPLRLYASRWQSWWDTRWERLPEIFRELSPQYQRYAAMLAAASPQDYHAASGQIADAIRPADPLPAAAPGEGDGAQVAARIAQEQARLAAVPDDFRPDPAMVAALPRVMNRKWASFADALEQATRGRPVSPGQLTELSGMSESWVHQMLKRLSGLEVVTQVSRGRYAPAGSDGDVAAAMEVIRSADDDLLREFRQSRRRVNSA